LGAYTFDHCTALANVDLPNSVTTMGNWIFNKCDSLTSITIPANVQSMGERPFSFCGSLKSVTVLATTPPTLGANAFYGTHSSLKIYVPSASVKAYKTATNWNSYSSKIYAIPS
jgi:hypothetical protein